MPVLPAPTRNNGLESTETTRVHIEDSPADAGPLANLSPAITPSVVDAAVRKVADWQLARSRRYFDRTWTWSVLNVGFHKAKGLDFNVAASDSTGDPKYRDAILSMSENFNSALVSHLPNADGQSLGQPLLNAAGIFRLRDRCIELRSRWRDARA